MNTQDFKLVDAFASWCKPCARMSDTLDAIEDDIDVNNVNIIKLDVEDNYQFAEQHKVTTIPTLFLFDSKDNLVSRWEGNQEYGDVKNWIVENTTNEQ